MSNGLNRYKKRTQRNPQESYLNQAKREFQDYFNQAPNKFKFQKFTDKKEYECTWIDVDKGNYYQSYDDKFILTECCIGRLEKGEVLTFKDNHFNKKEWMVIDEENLGVDSHKKYRIRPTNGSIKFKVGSRIYNLPALLENQTLYATGINDTNQVSYPNAIFNVQIGMIFEGSKYLNRGLRFMNKINNTISVYKVTYMHLNKNILAMQCTEDTIMIEDDLENLIAYNDFGSQEVINYEIVGKSDINSESEYYIKNATNEDFAFEVDDLSVVDIRKKDNKSCILIPKKVTDWVKLSAKLGDLTLEKDILVKGR